MKQYMKNKRIFQIFMVIPALFLISCERDTRTNGEQYLDDLKEAREENDFHTELYILPESIERKEINFYHFVRESGLFTGSYLFYMGLTFEEEDYNAEITRLSNIKSTFKEGTIKPIIHYQENHMFVTIHKDNRYEYVIYNNDLKEIVYVSNQLFKWKDIPVKAEHVIPKITIPDELDDGENSYNMYYRYEFDGVTTVGWYVND